ncbi:MAG: hypothetical protein ACHQRM_17275 [Bacteroidia bacterium]
MQTLHRVHIRIYKTRVEKQKGSQESVIGIRAEPGPVVAMLHKVWSPAKVKAKRKRDAEKLQALIAALPPLTQSPLEKANREASRFTVPEGSQTGAYPVTRLNIHIKPCTRPLPPGLIKVLEHCQKPVLPV